MGFFNPLDEDDFASEEPLTLEDPVDDRPHHEGGGGLAFADLVAAIFGLATLAVIVASILLARNPSVAWNPFPPGSPPPTPTLVAIAELPTRTPTAAPPTATLAPLPSATPSPFPSPTILPESFSGPTNTPSRFPFTLQNESVGFISNPNGLGCNWLGVVGQALDLSGEPALQLAVQVKGEGFEWIAFTGSAPAYGASGFEVKLGPAVREAEFEVQLYSTTGVALSEPIVIRTSTDCQQNTAVVVFVQNYAYTR